MDVLRGHTYKIGQAASLLGVKTYVLRFWEDEFPMLRAERTSTGQRRYTEEHIRLLRTIKHLLYERGMTIEGARKELSRSSRSRLLVEISEELTAIRRLLDAPSDS